MRERINKLAKGIVEQEVPRLTVQPTEIRANITVGTTGKGEFYISSENGLSIKGILYSTHSRVKTVFDTFHRLHNCVVYEVNTEYMENGDVIEGAFHVVTNAGEVEIPYSFHVCLAAAGKVLESLTEVQTFAAVAKADWNTAQNLFVYRSFIEAPFMKQTHIRTLYDGLIESTDKELAMEEFLLALRAKEPVEVFVDTTARNFYRLREAKQDSIRMKKRSWGYLRVSIHTDGEFIRIDRAELTEEDFRDDIAEVSFTILPEKMHKGKNYGSICVWAGNQLFRVPIEASLEQGRESAHGQHIAKYHWMQYLKERLFFECGGYSPQTAWLKLQSCVDQMEADHTVSEKWILVLRTEILLESGQKERAELTLNECRSMLDKEKNPMLKGMYQYLHWRLYQGKEEGERLADYLRQCQQKEPDNYFYLYILEKVDSSFGQNVFGILKEYRTLFMHGCRSPFLYVKVCRLFNRETSFLRSLDAFEFQSLWFGRSYGMIGKKLAVAAANVGNSQYRFEKKYVELFASFYEQHSDSEILAAVLRALIQRDVREEWAFSWYEKGVREGLPLTRLYEYYLYTLPASYAKPLPKEILLYFSYTNMMNAESYERLYENLVLYWKQDSSMYQLYERSMEKYALKQLFESKISRVLAVLYDRILYPEMIDLPVARVLPFLLNTRRIVCEEPQMKYVLVCSEELDGCEAYLLKDNEAYVPLYSENSILLFQDVYGNRYANVSYQSEKIIQHPEYLERCFVVYPEHPMLRLAESKRLLEGTLLPSQTSFLERMLQEMPIKPLYRQKVLEKILQCYHRALNQGEKLDVDLYLLGLPKETLSKRERLGISRILIAQNHMDEVYKMMQQFQMDDITGNDARKLISRIVMQSMGRKDDFLLLKAFQVFQDEKADEMILDYLCEHYNGSIKEMYAVLEAAIREKVETYDLEERLLGQILFTGSMETCLDTVFEWYAARKKQDNTLVKAYFTAKCMAYFMNGVTVPQKVFTYLESMVRRILYKAKIPDIYQLALTRYYAEKGDLNQEQGRLCYGMVQNLLHQGKVFPYFQQLTKWAEIPDDLMDKAMMEYHGKMDVRPVLLLRVLPDETSFHAETMRHMYRGIYVKEKILFADETMEYKVAEEDKGVLKIVEEGSVSCQRFPADGVVNRMTCINEICRSLSEGQEEEKKKKMQEYGKMTAMARVLFELL